MLACLFVLNLEYICIFKFETGSIQMYVSLYFCACTLNIVCISVTPTFGFCKTSMCARIEN